MHNEPRTPTWRAGERVTVRGHTWTVLQCTPYTGCEALRLASTTEGTRTVLVPFDRPRAARARPLEVARLRRWMHRLRDLMAETYPYGGLRFCPPGIQLLPYQLEPAIAMIRDGCARVLIADGVGLGKTIQAGLVASELAGASDAFRALILTPAGLRAQWKGELVRHFGLDPVEADAAWLRAAVREIPADVNPWSLPGVYLSSFDFVKRPEALRPLEDVRWDLLVVDEAHAAAIGTDRRAAIDAIASRARRILLLTATPHPGDPDQFAALCAIGAGPDRAAPVIFQRRRTTSPETGPRRSTLLIVRLEDVERRMHRLLEAYTSRVWAESVRPGRTPLRLVSVVLRKRALSSAGALAVSVRRRLDLLSGAIPEAAQLFLPIDGFDEDPLDDAVPDRVLASAGLADADAERRALRDIAETAERAAVAESKRRVLLRLLARLSEPVIVFTEYRDTLQRLHEWLTATGRPAMVIHGGMSARERLDAVAAFNARGGTLLATDAASEGLNLQQGCRVVVHYELPWNPSRMEQRAGRVDRIGQRRRVHEIALVASDTAEALVLGPLARRAARGAAADGLVVRLTESRIAERLIAGRPLEDQLPVGPPAAVTVDCRDEAVAEAARLEEHRAFVSEGRRSSRRTRRVSCVPVSIRRSRPPLRDHPNGSAHTLQPGVVLVFQLAVADGRARPIEVEAIALHLPCSPPGPPQSRRAIREWTQALLDRTQHAVLARLDGIAAGRIAALAPMYQRALAAAHSRERDISASLPSAAQQLVQAGLFDRRAVAAATARQRTAADLRADATDEVDSLARAARLSASTELRAILLIGGR